MEDRKPLTGNREPETANRGPETANRPIDSLQRTARENVLEVMSEMAKKAKAKSNKKTPVTAKPRKARAAAKDESKYDQPGAPWWKKYRPSETRAV
jgi:hypothetical protein